MIGGLLPSGIKGFGIRDLEAGLLQTCRLRAPTLEPGLVKDREARNVSDL